MIIIFFIEVNTKTLRMYLIKGMETCQSRPESTASGVLTSAGPGSVALQIYSPLSDRTSACWTLAHDILAMKQGIKKLYTSSNYTSFRPPGTKF